VAGPTPRDGERGWALVSVLWGVAMLSLMAAALQTLTTTTLRGEALALNAARAEATLDATLTRAVLGITDRRLDQRWHINGAVEEFTFDDVSFRIQVQDELGRIDLNAAPGDTLRALLRSVDVPMHELDVLADNILQWRSTSGLELLNAVDEDTYETLGYRPRHGPFQSVDELKLVIGMTPDLFERIAPALTVYTRQPMIEPSVATSEALAAYPSLVNDAFSLESRGESLAEGLLPLEIPLAARVFSVTVEGDMEGRTLKRTTIIQMTGDEARPLFVMYRR